VQKRENIVPVGIQDNPAMNAGWEKVPGSQGINFQDHLTMFPILAFVAMVLVLGFFLSQLNKGKSKPKRRRPRLRKIQRITYTSNMPGV
jgi:membrane-bound transcription factor site-1 protease